LSKEGNDAFVKGSCAATVAQLKSAKPIVAKAVSERTAKVVGGIYNLQDGVVELLAWCGRDQALTRT